MKAIRFEARIAGAKAVKVAKSTGPECQWPVDFITFWTAILGVKPAKHHEDWIKALITGDGSILHSVSGPHLTIRGPRDSAKSTFCALVVAWAIGTNPGIRVIYTSYSDAVALEQSRRIKRIISSVEYQAIFPWIKIGKRNNESDWEIDKHWASLYPRPRDIKIPTASDLISTYTLYATGILGSIMGRRADLIISDDLVKSSQSISNKDVRAKIWENVNSVLRPCLVNGGRWINVSMLCRADDINLAYFNPDNQFKILTTRAIILKGEREYSYWPERHPLAALRIIRDRSPKMFSLQYQNQEPTNTELLSIQPDWIRWVQESADYRRYLLAIDLASGDSIRSDSTGYCLAGITVNNECHILSSKLVNRHGNLAILKDLVGYKNDYPSLTLVFESNAYQHSLEGDYRTFVHTPAGAALMNTRLIAVPSTKDIHTRLEDVSGVIENGFVLFVSGGKGLSRLVGNITTDLAELSHDDDVSSFALCVSTARRYLHQPSTWQA